MKFALTVLMTILPSLALAQVPPRGLVCYGHGRTLDMNFEGGRFSDNVGFSFHNGENISNLLEADEDVATVSSASLHVSLMMGACERGDLKNVLARCSSKQGHAIIAQFDFKRVLPMKRNPKAKETISISRSLGVEDLEVEVRTEPATDFQGKPLTLAFAHVKLVGSVAGRPVTQEFKQRLGEWTDKPNRSHWDRCIFE